MFKSLISRWLFEWCFDPSLQPPYVVDRWNAAGHDNSPIYVECNVSYEVSAPQQVTGHFAEIFCGMKTSNETLREEKIYQKLQ